MTPIYWKNGANFGRTFEGAVHRNLVFLPCFNCGLLWDIKSLFSLYTYYYEANFVKWGFVGIYVIFIQNPLFRTAGLL